MSSDEIPSLSNLLSQSINSFIAKISTCTPAKIEKYDNKKCKANVTPLIKKVYRDGTEESMPVINNVPVIFPRSKDSIISFPLNKGDLVLLVFSDRSLDHWLSGSGKESKPGNKRKFDLSDAIAIPGLYPFGVDSDALENSFLIKYKKSKIELDGDKIAIGTSSVELLDLIDQILTAIQAITVTHEGVHPINNISAFSSIQSNLSAIKGTFT